MGNRIWRETDIDSAVTTRKYIVDISSGLPTILCELNGATVAKSYIYSDRSQILCQRTGGMSADEKFYVADRLGSVRQIVDAAKAVVANYTYSPFGEMLEEGGTFDNNFKFTGQWLDSEIAQYYFRARMYDYYLARFTSNDPAKGKSKQLRIYPAKSQWLIFWVGVDGGQLLRCR